MANGKMRGYEIIKQAITRYVTEIIIWYLTQLVMECLKRVTKLYPKEEWCAQIQIALDYISTLPQNQAMRAKDN